MGAGVPDGTPAWYSERAVHPRQSTCKRSIRHSRGAGSASKPANSPSRRPGRSPCSSATPWSSPRSRFPPTSPQLPFFPLTVEYREKTYAAGKIPGGFLKREGRPSDKEILACRIIDRSIRPLFPEGFKNEVQVFVTVVSADQENDADILGA